MKPTARIALFSGVAAALLAGAGACSSSSNHSSGSGSPPAASAPATPAPAAAGTITITNFVFSGPLTVPAGATVAVTNTDSVDHTVTSDGLSQFNVQAPAGQTVMFQAPSAPGSYPFHCSIHPQMHGMLIVK
jgi:plastocyanin